MFVPGIAFLQNSQEPQMKRKEVKVKSKEELIWKDEKNEYFKKMSLTDKHSHILRRSAIKKITFI